MTRAAVALVALAVGCTANWVSPDDTTDSDVAVDETSIVTAFCAAGGASWGGDLEQVGCFSPGDPANWVVTGEGLLWEPGPIVRLQPAEE